MQTKICSKCGKELPIRCFYVLKKYCDRKDGSPVTYSYTQNVCKNCQKKRVTSWVIQHTVDGTIEKNKQIRDANYLNELLTEFGL